MTDHRKNNTSNEPANRAADDVGGMIDAEAAEASKSMSKPAPKPTPCPICSKDALSTDASYPFCSQRCRNVDLGRWLDGAYLISRPIEQDDLEQDD